MGQSLIKKIEDELKISMKDKDRLRISTLRMVIASAKNLSIEKKVDAIEDRDLINIISKQIKQHHDSIESFKKGGRQDLVEKEETELKILTSYMPEQLSEEKIAEIVKKVISRTGANSKKDFGNVIKLSMEEIKGRADGKTISSVVQKLLPT